MLNIAVCDDSRTDVEMLESAFDKLAQYQFSYTDYSGKAGVRSFKSHAVSSYDKA